MIKVNEKNLVSIVKELLNYEKAFSYNSECFSSSDVTRSVAAGNDVDYFLFNICKQGIDIERRLKSLEVGDLKFHNGEGFVELKPDDFEYEIRINNFEDYLKRNNMDFDWLTANKTVVKLRKHYKELDLGFPRWVFREWSIDDSAVEYLKENSIVFKKSCTLIESLRSGKAYYGSKKSTFNVVSISEMHDGYSNEEQDCSSFVIVMDRDGKKDSYEKITLVIQEGGFYSDIVVLNNRGNVERIIPLEGVNPLNTRKFSNNLAENINKYILELKNYKIKLAQ